MTTKAQAREIPVLRIWGALLILTALALGSLAIFTFGMVCFAGLLVLWFKTECHRRDAIHLVQGVMLFLCTIWFIFNVIAEFYKAEIMMGWLFVIAVIFPPLIAHLYYLEVALVAGRNKIWELFVGGIYLLSLGTAVGISLMTLGVVDVGMMNAGIALMFVLTGLFALTGIFCALFYRNVSIKESKEKRSWRRSSLSLLAAMVLIFITIIIANLGWIENLSDYFAVLSRSMPLLFLFVNTYYESKFEFFDVFIKRATLFFLALLILRLYFEAIPGFVEALDMDEWKRSWVYSLTLIPFVIVLPWIYRKASQLLDRFWIGRTFNPVDAVKYFLEGIQEVTLAKELSIKAENRLSIIFQAPVHIQFKGLNSDEEPEFNVVESIPIPSSGQAEGMILLGLRRNQTPYFAEDITLLSALSDVTAYLLQNLNLQKKKQEQEIREQELILDASRSELKALRAQINPHFLFNALNVIASLTQRDPDRAEATVEELAEVFRYTLSRSEQEWVRVEDEIEFIRAYLEVEKARFGERLKVEINLDENDADQKIPTMMLQTMVENAVKHGVSETKGASLIQINVRSNHDFVELEVIDNGPGLKARESDSRLQSFKKKSGYGLKNIRSRLRGYFGTEDGLILERIEDTGQTRARIRIPKVGTKNAQQTPWMEEHGQ